MGRGSLPFKESDVVRLLRAAKKAGVPCQIEIDLEHKLMRIIPVQACGAETRTNNDWDTIYDKD
jgi:hypothetical protein